MKKKIVKKVKKVSQNTKNIFSSIIIRKDCKNIDQKNFTGKLIFKKLLQSKKYRLHSQRQLKGRTLVLEKVALK